MVVVIAVIVPVAVLMASGMTDICLFYFLLGVLFLSLEKYIYIKSWTLWWPT